MSSTDRLVKAREYIAKGDEYYAKAADEIATWLDGDASRTHQQAADHVGKNRKWVGRLLAARARTVTDATQDFEVDWESGSNKRDEVAAKVMADVEQAKHVLAALPAEQVEHIAQAATEVAVDRARAQRAEHQTESTTSDLMGPEPFDPSEYWADTLVIRVNRNARELASLIKKAGGLLFGTMPPEEAFDYLHEAERLIAEARAAAQEIVRDRTEV